MTRRPPFAVSALVVALGLAWAAAATAGDAAPRDPMLPPPDARPAPAPGAAPAPAALPQARHLMVVDGKRYVIDGGRRRAVGDLLAGARIERIEDSAVVVRAGGSLQRLPLYTGVVKRAVIEPAAPASAAEMAKPVASPVAKPDIPPTRAKARATPSTRTAQAPLPCADRPSCTQRPGEPR